MVVDFLHDSNTSDTGDRWYTCMILETSDCWFRARPRERVGNVRLSLCFSLTRSVEVMVLVLT